MIFFPFQDKYGALWACYQKYEAGVNDKFSFAFRKVVREMQKIS